MKILYIAIAILALILWCLLWYVVIKAYHNGWKRVDTRNKFNEDTEDDER